MIVNILGQKWDIVRAEETEDENLEDIGGYADFSVRKIVIKKIHKEKGTVENVEDYMNKVTRHEIVHAFLIESGLHVNSLKTDEAWATNEEMVDWFAFQGPKIYKAWEEANAL